MKTLHYATLNSIVPLCGGLGKPVWEFWETGHKKKTKLKSNFRQTSICPIAYCDPSKFNKIFNIFKFKKVFNLIGFTANYIQFSFIWLNNIHSTHTFIYSSLVL